MLGHHDFWSTKAEGHEQMDYALEKELIFGIQPRCILFLHVRNLRDTEIIGTWFKKTGRREEVVLASKMANPNFIYAREE
jgi:hypothetical protein